MFHHVTCLTVRCDICRTSAEIEEATAHFATAAQAVAELTDCGWEFEPGDRAVCDQCAAARACAADGHLWESWRPCGCRGDLPRHRALHLTAGAVAVGACACETRWCSRCQGSELRPATNAKGAA